MNPNVSLYSQVELSFMGFLQIVENLNQIELIIKIFFHSQLMFLRNYRLLKNCFPCWIIIRNKVLGKFSKGQFNLTVIFIYMTNPSQNCLTYSEDCNKLTEATSTQ